MKRVLLAAAAILTAAAPAHAETLAALLGPSRIAMIDTGSMTVGRIMTLDGVGAGLVGIDVRPADGMLYGLGGDGAVHVIDTAAATVTHKSTLKTMPPAGARVTVDFNPVADRLRVIGSDGSNLRANVDDGMVTTDGRLRFADTDMLKDGMPEVVAGAYTNSVKGTKETTLYDIDGKAGVLTRQAPPNDGVLTTIGKLGITGSNLAFDIASDAAMTNTGWLLAGGTLHRVDLASGQARSVGKIAGATGEILDIAVLPAAR